MIYEVDDRFFDPDTRLALLREISTEIGLDALVEAITGSAPTDDDFAGPVATIDVLLPNSPPDVSGYLGAIGRFLAAWTITTSMLTEKIFDLEARLSEIEA